MAYLGLRFVCNSGGRFARCELYIHRESKKHLLLSISSPNTNVFCNFFRDTLNMKFARKQSLKIPSHLKSVATLLCEKLMSEN